MDTLCDLLREIEGWSERYPARSNQAEIGDAFWEILPRIQSALSSVQIGPNDAEWMAGAEPKATAIGGACMLGAALARDPQIFDDPEVRDAVLDLGMKILSVTGLDSEIA